MTGERHGDAVDRLRRIEGQVRGVERMIDSGRYCSDILMQLSAVRAALDEVERGLLHDHLRVCLTRLARTPGGASERARRIEEILGAVGRLPRWKGSSQ